MPDDGTGPAPRERALWAGAQVGLLGVLAATTGLGAAGWLAGLGYAGASWLLLGRSMRRAGTRVPGPADRVTAARMVLVGGVTASVADQLGQAGQAGPALPPLVLALTATALALDLADGRVARRTGTESALGARFDMEVDAFLILVLSGHVALSTGPWVLGIGGLRYAFVAASWALPWLRADLPPSVLRKAVAALQGIVLAVLASGLLPYPAVVAGFALAALAFSFGRDCAWLWRRRRAAGSMTVCRAEGLPHA
ncbi:CDP-alcohol phosphatidyltransferase family protein [Prauserella shujinwangii]|uniref:CDP-alcohol phosphatidyltransferase family protein n=1 Tax=Prauserella shujinwangii TaxID=1453103 RepID=UPI001FE6BA4E|nr:CDP-alcohol phosphatidyltransferase family protein [Prauserella shujinwangii]